MYRVSWFMGLAILGAALLVGSGTSQEKKDPVKKTLLPQGFSKLNLTKDQKGKMQEVQVKYRMKIKVLEEQIAELRTQERMDLVGLLTAEQKELYRKIQLGEDTKKSGDK
jgi:hypothetical protein